jgi:predicted molibdopterin-dependent oxidoreductase YjgC
MVMGRANLAMATGNIGRRGVGVNPLRGQNNVQGSCDMGSFRTNYPATGTCPTTASARSTRSSGVRRC